MSQNEFPRATINNIFIIICTLADRQEELRESLADWPDMDYTWGLDYSEAERQNIDDQREKMERELVSISNALAWLDKLNVALFPEGRAIEEEA